MLRVWVDVNGGGALYPQGAACLAHTYLQVNHLLDAQPFLGGPPAGPPVPCVLTGSCFLSLEAVLVVDLAQMGKRLQGPESMSPGRVLWRSQGGRPMLERQVQRPHGSQCPELAQGKGRGNSRVVPGVKPQAPLAEPWMAQEMGSQTVWSWARHLLEAPPRQGDTP